MAIEPMEEISMESYVFWCLLYLLHTYQFAPAATLATSSSADVLAGTLARLFHPPPSTFAALGERVLGGRRRCYFFFLIEYQETMLHCYGPPTD